jgi:hypothetical protein
MLNLWQGRERDSGSPYQSRESLSGVTRDCSKEMLAPDLNDFKRLLSELVKENRALRGSLIPMKEDIKTLRDSLMSTKDEIKATE